MANEIGKLIADYTGRGAQKSRAFVQQDPAVERLTRRSVHTFMSGSDESGASSVEAFVLEPEAS